MTTASELAENGIDVERGKERVQQIINGSADKPARRKRSDAGTHRQAKADSDEIVLRVTLEQAKLITKRLCGAVSFEGDELFASIQDQIIAQLQKRINALTAK